MNAFYTLVGIVVIVSLVLLVPFLTIWSVNVLFSTNIPYTMETLAAAFILLALFMPKSTMKVKHE